MNKALHHSITCMFLIIVFFAGAYKLQSQNIGRFELPHYDQLPNRQIKKIFQDSEGLIWYCTEDGLCRDDGYNIQIFRSDFKTPDVIKHNHITCITEDLSGKIWFGTLRGAYKSKRPPMVWSTLPPTIKCTVSMPVPPASPTATI